MHRLADFDPPRLAEELIHRGHKPSHARLILLAFYRDDGALDVDSLRGSRALLADLRTNFTGLSSTVRKRHLASDGTIKLLIGFAQGGVVESVLMPTTRPGMAAGCVSSQIGCAMGCDFCASTRGGLERNLDAGEIVEQFLHLRRAALAQGRRTTWPVFIGMGEPLANLDNIIPAVKRIADAPYGALGWRQV